MRSGGCSISIISPTAPFVASGLVLFRTILNLVADPKSPHANSVLIFVVEFYPCGFESPHHLSIGPSAPPLEGGVFSIIFSIGFASRGPRSTSRIFAHSISATIIRP
jgi:hypothetical protein